VVEGGAERGVGEGERQGVADLADREPLVLLEDLLPDEADDLLGHLDPLQVDDRDAVLAAQEVEEILVAEETEAAEDGAESLVGAALLRGGLLGRVGAEQVLLDEQLQETRIHDSQPAPLRSVRRTGTPREKWGIMTRACRVHQAFCGPGRGTGRVPTPSRRTPRTGSAPLGG